MSAGGEGAPAAEGLRGIPVPREPAEPASSADVLRAYGLEALVELLETSGYGVCVTGDDHTWEYVNPAGARILGQPFEALRGRDYLLHFPEHERAALLALEEDQRGGDTGFYTNTVVQPGGTEVEMTWSGSVMHADGRELAPAIFHETGGVHRAHAEAASLGAVAGRIAAGEAVGEVLSALVAEAVSSTRAAGAVLLVEEGGRLVVAARSGVAPAFDDAVARSGAGLADLPSGDLLRPGGVVHLSDDGERIAGSPRTSSWPAAVGVPWAGAVKAGVRGPDGLVGCLVVLLPPTVTAPDEVELTFWAALADSAAVALDNERLRRQVAHSAAVVERQRLARDLHDSVSQALFSLHARAAVVRRALDADQPGLAREAAEDLEALSRQALAEMRELLVELRPDAVREQGGLARTLEVLAASVTAQDGLTVEPVCCPDPSGLAPDTAEHLYRIAREALHNAVKHAGASRALLALAVEGVELVLSVADDGCGFETGGFGTGGFGTGGSGTGGGSETSAGVATEGGSASRYGQRTMRERAQLCGGVLLVSSRPGAGTVVTARVPLAR